MKRKVYFQISIILYIGLALFLAMMLACLYVVIEFLNVRIQNATAYEWLGFFAAIGGFLYMAYTFYRMARNRIILDKDEIFIPEHWGNKDNKIQYETHIAYKDIANIFLVITSNNSLNKTAHWVFTPMPYVVFDCKDGSQKLINVFYYSKNQVVKIIDETIARSKETENELEIKTGTEILSDFLALQKKKK